MVPGTLYRSNFPHFRLDSHLVLFSVPLFPAVLWNQCLHLIKMPESYRVEKVKSNVSKMFEIIH